MSPMLGLGKGVVLGRRKSSWCWSCWGGPALAKRRRRTVRWLPSTALLGSGGPLAALACVGQLCAGRAAQALALQAALCLWLSRLRFIRALYARLC